MPLIANEYADINLRMRQIEMQRRRALGRLPVEADVGLDSLDNYETIWHYPPSYSEAMLGNGYSVFNDDDAGEPDAGDPAVADDDDDDDDHIGYLIDTGFV